MGAGARSCRKHIFVGAADSEIPRRGPGNGKLEFKITYTGQNGQPQYVKCEYAKHFLDSVMSKDPYMGWGYRIMIPFEAYQPWIKHIRVEARFVPEKGIPVYANPHTFGSTRKGSRAGKRNFKCRRERWAWAGSACSDESGMVKLESGSVEA